MQAEHYSEIQKGKRYSSTKWTTESFTARAEQIHNNFYNYSKTQYTGIDTHVIITCPEHGDFKQTPYMHLQGQGCPKCGILKRAKAQTLNTEEFVEKAKQIHGNKYDYSKVDYKTRSERVIIICSKHGEFLQTPADHLDKCGCPRCRLKEQNRFYETIQRKLPEIELKWEACPKWLSPRRLDLYSEKYNFAIEYNGIQHYQPIRFFGGEERFKQQIIEDEQKQRDCEAHGCRLFVVKYDYTEEDIDELVNNIKKIIDNYEVKSN